MGFFDFLDPSAFEDMLGAGGEQAATGAIPTDTSSFAPPDVSGFSSGAVPDVANIAGANSAFTSVDGGPAPMGAPTGTPPGMPPNLPPAPDATIGGVAPGQANAAPSTAWESQNPTNKWWATPGEPGGTGGPNSVSGGAVPSDPTAMSTPSPGASGSQPWYSRMGDKIATGAGNEVDQAMAHPISTGVKGLALAAPLVGAAIGAANQPKGPGKYTLNPPATPVAPLPGTTGNTAADIPAASPMSPLLGAGPQGGFNVKRQGFAQGGQVGVSDQDKADYEEAMRQFRGQPAQPAPKPPQTSTYDQQLQDADKGKQTTPGSYFRPWSK
jgi:hypothetical protein